MDNKVEEIASSESRIRKAWYSVKKAFLTVFGDIKIFRWPLFIVYQPTSFKVHGEETRKIMTLLEPGDVVMRSYVDYLDGYFIPKGFSRCSHSGLYLGDGRIVHSIAEGSQMIDVIDFCRADRIVVLRPDGGQAWAIEHARKCADASIPYNFDFRPGTGKYYCHEFTASCFPHIDIQQISRPIFGFISSPKAFLADSFYQNPCFCLVHESSKE